METLRIPGTTFDKVRNKWKAQLRIAGKLKNLGFFATQAQAAEAVVAARGGDLPEPVVEVEFVDWTPSEAALIKHNQAKPQVFQSNALVEAVLSNPSKHAKYEFRLFMRMLQCPHQLDEKLEPIVVPVSTFMPSLDGDYLKTLGAACDSIMSRKLKLPPLDGLRESFSLRTLVISLDYVHSKRAVIGKFHPDLTPHLIQLKSHFTFGDIDVLMKLKTIHSQRFYWLFKEWAGLYKGNEKTITVEELRVMTSGKGSYGMWNDFKRIVMLPAIKELSSHGFQIKYEEKLKGKTVKEVVFRVKTTKTDQLTEQEMDQVAVPVAAVIDPLVIEQTGEVKRANQFDEAYFKYLVTQKGHKFGPYYRHMVQAFKFSHDEARTILEQDVVPILLMEKISRVMEKLRDRLKVYPDFDDAAKRNEALDYFFKEFGKLFDKLPL